MNLYDLDTKVTQKSYEILDSYIESAKNLNSERISEIRLKCRDLLEKNGIFEDIKNGIIYQNIEVELDNLAENIDIFNEDYFEEITKNKIDIGIEGVTQKLDALNSGKRYRGISEELRYNRVRSENHLRDIINNFFDNYKARTLQLLSESGYSQNTIDDMDMKMEDFTTSKVLDIYIEKLAADRMKNVELLVESLDELNYNVLSEAEARYNCDLKGIHYDELKEKRDELRQKALKLSEIKTQIKNIELKERELK